MSMLLFLRMALLVMLTRWPSLSVPVTETHHGSGGTDSYIIMRPARRSLGGFPVLEPVSETDPSLAIARNVFERTFVKKMVRLNDYVQTSLVKDGTIREAEPLYLLLSGKMGGFPREGFWLSVNGKLLDKRKTAYVDLPSLEEDYARLSSVTQIYPHELAHIFYSRMAAGGTRDDISWSSDMHYFSLVSDYYKAFNEGYAESFETLSIAQEEDTAVIAGTGRDIAALATRLPRMVKGYERDCRWPLRAGFYKLSTVTWYQKLENYKRAVWSNNGLAKYRSISFTSRNPEREIVYRQTCAIPDTMNIRSVAEAASTEGVVSAFFTQLRQTGLKTRYMPRSWYFPFVGDTVDFGNPLDELDEMENQLLKEFSVMRKYLRQAKGTTTSPLHDFINGYIAEFPGEAEVVMETYRKVTGHPYQFSAPPELWVLNREHHHNSWVMAQFGGAELPFYTFNLNTAHGADLETLEGMMALDAGRIVMFRDSAGYFSSAGEIRSIAGMKPVSVASVTTAMLNPRDPVLTSAMSALSAGRFIIHLVIHLLYVTIILAAAVSGVQYFLSAKPAHRGVRAVVLFFRNFFKAWLFLIVCVAPFLFKAEPLLVLLIFVVFLTAFNLWRTVRKPEKRREVLFSTLCLAVYFSYSLV